LVDAVEKDVIAVYRISMFANVRCWVFNMNQEIIAEDYDDR
jgi:hypothetical protein